MPKWEYKILTVTTIKDPDDLDEMEKILNRLGDENWELISTIDDGDVMLFKRPCFNILPLGAKSRIQKEMDH